MYSGMTINTLRSMWGVHEDSVTDVMKDAVAIAKCRAHMVDGTALVVEDNVDTRGACEEGAR